MERGVVTLHSVPYDCITKIQTALKIVHQLLRPDHPLRTPWKDGYV